MRGTDFRVAKNFSAAGAVGAVEDMQERRFTGAGAANDPDHFPGVQIKADAVQHFVLGLISFTQITHA